ncbi:MAG: efflux RND transporter periplasmic adaptor subunit [Candidatus Atribacteria bacterium]|nr:efflux RND transporter periplasmic adaptor subunit [Candidatus Atribacteria bacterium]
MGKRKKIIIVLVVVVVGIVTGFYLWKMRTSQNTRQAQITSNQSRQVKVTVGTIIESISALGSLEPMEVVDVKSEVDGGKVEEILIKEGDTVEKGQPLIKLDVSDYETNLKQAQANYLNAKTELDKLITGATELEITQVETAFEQTKINLDTSREQFKRNQELFTTGAISQQQYQDSRDQMNVNEQNYISAQKKMEDLKQGTKPEDIEVSRAKLTQTEANLASTQKKVSSATITSPIKGTVIDLIAQKDDVATLAGTLVTVADLSTMKALVPINEIDVPRIKKGDKAEATLDAFPGEVFHGEITFLAYKPVIKDNIVTYEATVQVPNPDGRLRRGMTVDVKTIIDTREKTLFIPIDILVESPKGATVMVPGPDGSPVPKPVKVGLRNDTQVEILEGLEKDQVVLLPTVATPAPNQRSGGGPGGF